MFGTICGFGFRYDLLKTIWQGEKKRLADHWYEAEMFANKRSASFSLFLFCSETA